MYIKIYVYRCSSGPQQVLRNRRKFALSRIMEAEEVKEILALDLLSVFSVVVQQVFSMDGIQHPSPLELKGFKISAICCCEVFLHSFTNCCVSQARGI